MKLSHILSLGAALLISSVAASPVFEGEAGLQGEPYSLSDS